MMDPRYAVRDCSELLSPSLLIYPKVVRENLETMIAMAGGAERLRPHVKTHKMAEIVRLAESLGIHRHKCATIAEAEMVATAGGADVLLAYPLVGPNVKRFIHARPSVPRHGLPGDRRSRRRREGSLIGGSRA